MTAQNNLDLTGSLVTHPLAELLVEILQARLNGSLRLSNDDQKVIVYFDRGTAIFAISNSRVFRIFDILLKANRIDKQFLSVNPNYTNDLEFGRVLIAKGVIAPEEMDQIFSDQIGAILKNAFSWDSGSWTFSPLARLKEGIRFKVDLNKMLIEHARGMTGEAVYRRFKSVQETFTLRSEIEEKLDLLPHEAFVLTRFPDSAFSVEQVKTVSGMPETATFHTLYTLWVGGFLVRRDWNAAFSDNKLRAILSAKLELKKEAVQRDPQPDALPAANNKTAPVIEKAAEKPEPEPQPAEEEISLTDYLARSADATTHYEMLGIEIKTDLAGIKQAYFSLAKRFHPDHFHSEADAGLLAKIQASFTKLAQAYDVLKNQDSRDAYDFRMRKELAEQERRSAAGVSKEDINKQLQSEQGVENFDQGFTLLMDEEYEAAVPYLARAVFFSPDNPRYRAYYGKALSADDKQRHKAESEMQTAIRMDPTNPAFKIILVEFFIQMNMIKRAEGELTRLLSVFPSNREARVLLDSLRNK